MRQMIKQIGVFLILSIVFTACSTYKSSNEPIAFGEIHITADMSMEYPTKVNSYSIEYMEMDAQQLKNSLLKNEISEYNKIAEGEQWITQKDGIEFLTKYSNEFYGGFLYLYFSDSFEDPFKMDEWLSILTMNTSPTFHEQVIGHTMMKNYENEEIASKDKREVINETLLLLENIGVDGVEVDEVIAKDHETLNINKEIYNDAQKNVQKVYEEMYPEEQIDVELIEYEFSNSDEEYEIYFREEIDGIPIQNIIWTNDRANELTIIANVNADGALRKLYITKHCKINEKISEDRIIGPDEAVAIYSDKLELSGMFEDIEVYLVELSYIAVTNNNNRYLIPAWMIYTSKELEELNPANNQPIIEYKTTVINAISGEFIEKESDFVKAK